MSLESKKNHQKTKVNFLTIPILPSLLMSLESKKNHEKTEVNFLMIAILPSLLMSLESKNYDSTKNIGVEHFLEPLVLCVSASVLKLKLWELDNGFEY